MDHYFAFHKLEAYMDMFNAVWISLALFFFVWTVALIYYDVFRHMHVRRSVAPKKKDPLT